MTPRRFPRSPDIASRPFDGGPNPFADDIHSEYPATENPLSGPVESEVQPYKPTDYVQTLPERSPRVLLYGAIGAILIGLSVLILIVVATTLPILSAEIVYCFPTALLGLAFTIPAWVMGRSDLRAMRAKAMDPAGLFRTQIGFWCGCSGTIIGIIPFALTIIAIVLEILN